MLVDLGFRSRNSIFISGTNFVATIDFSLAGPGNYFLICSNVNSLI